MRLAVIVRAQRVAVGALLACLGLLAPGVSAAPPKPVVLAVIGHAGDAGRLAGAALGAGIAAKTTTATGPLAGGVLVESFDDGGTPAGFKKALRKLRARKPLAVLALPSADLEASYWKAARMMAYRKL